MPDQNKRIAILGAGNIGTAIADGLIQSDNFDPTKITLTRRTLSKLKSYQEKGFVTLDDNRKAVQQAEIIIVAVEPQQIEGVLNELKPSFDPERHMLISVVTGITVNQIKELVPNGVPVVRTMPNTAIAIREAMTCICSDEPESEAVTMASSIFNTVGQTLVIREEQMSSATALGACGTAFFLRAIRAASQGGIEIGFHANEALQIATQTAKGAACLLEQMENHPEFEIDKVTTPRGCTISGLNQMEHEGFSSAMIKGILLSAEKADGLYDE